MKDEQNVSRRDLIGGAFASTLALAMPPAVARAAEAAKDPAAAAALAKDAAKSARPVKIGFVGPGSRGQGDMQQLLRVPGLEIVAVCDIYEPNLKKGLELAGPNAKGYDDYRKMLEQKDIEAVAVATPLNWHAPIAIDSLNSGRHVFVEKMMAYSIEDAKKLVRTSERTGKLLQVGHQRRYSVDYHHALDLIKKGYFGDITHVRAQWNRNGSWRRAVPDPKLEKLMNWRLYKASSQGLMAELGSHQIDVTNWFLGMHPIAVTGMAGINTYKDGREVWDNVQCIFEYPNGAKLTYQSIQSNAFDDFTEQFMGPKGTLITSEVAGKSMMFQEQNAELEFAKFSQNKQSVGGKQAILLDAGATSKQDKRDRGDGQKLAASGVSKSSYYLEFEDWVDCIRTGRKPFCDGHIGLADTVCVLSANKAMEEGKRVAITEDMFKV